VGVSHLAFALHAIVEDSLYNLTILAQEVSMHSDLDCSSLNYTALMAAMLDPQDLSEADLRSVFDALDFDGDGQLGVQDLRRVFRGHASSMHSMKAICGSDQICFREFKEMLQPGGQRGNPRSDRKSPDKSRGNPFL